MTTETPAAGPEPRLETLRPLLRATLALLGVLALLDLALRSRDLARAFWGWLATATLPWTVGQVWWTIELDHRRLARAFQNLIENALHFTPEGGLVQVRIASAPDGRVLYEVRDEGPGLNRADAPRVFEPFFTKRRGGTGPGLSIVQRIVREHGGSVSLENDAERGAVARVWLPATPSFRADAPGMER